MGFFDWQYIVAFIVGVCCWLYSSVKKFQKQINKKNRSVPDINILRKILPPGCNNGWKIKTVCNALPVWSYTTTFTFAPNNVVATKSLLQGTSEKILAELKDRSVFAMIFPDFPTFQVKKNRNTENGDVMLLSNMFSSLSLSSILLTGQQSVLTFERYWSSGPVMSWLYVTPTVQLLTAKYGYWIAFLLEDVEGDKGVDRCILHILASYPSSVSSQVVNQRISACQVLIKDHVETLNQDEKKAGFAEDSAKTKEKRKHTSTPILTPVVSSLGSSPVSHTSFSSSSEAIGVVEEPALIHRTSHLPTTTTTTTTQPSGQSTKKTSTLVVDLHTSPHCDEKVSNVGVGVTPQAASNNTPVMTSESSCKGNDGKERKRKKKTKSPSTKTTTTTTTASTNQPTHHPKLEPYLGMIRESFEILLTIWEADEETEGWVLFNKKDGVTVHRKATTGEPGSFPADICKGVMQMNVPLPFLISYLKELDCRSEYDDMYECGEIVEELGGDLSAVINLVFRNMFLVTGRDFCSISATRHIKDNLYGIMTKAVLHPKCPERSNKVRGEIIIGGYVFEEVSVEPPVLNVMYAVCTNMNGQIPQKIVNKVLSDQPLSLIKVNKKITERYRDSQNGRSDKFVADGLEHFAKIEAQASVFPKVQVDVVVEEDEVEEDPVTEEPNVMIEDIPTESEPPGSLEEPPSYNELVMESENIVSTEVEVLSNSPEDSITTPELTRATSSTSHLDAVSPQITVSMDSIDAATELSVKDDHYSNQSDEDAQQWQKLSANGSSDTDEMEIGSLDENDSQLSDESNGSIGHYSFDHPRDGEGKIDYDALAYQATAALEGEYLASKRVDTTIKHHESAIINDVWMYRGTQKDVDIMRKTSSKQKFHSFLGRGIINVLPITVWEMIKTPTTRFVYDSMLKKISTIKQIDKKKKILYMRHETHACFVKQARDFCVLTVEAVREQRYVISGVSVDIPECPATSDCVRGRVFSSGWIIEPFIDNGKTVSLVTYISQVDLGRLPTRLVNFVSKRQPLAIAYLRSYLEAAER